ncbi:MAG TPA: ribokinase [Clostridiaceae bacterium]|nr:ribokinase [Clostridiaceae bacterium]
MRIINLGSLNIDYTYRVPHFVRPGETLESSDFTTRAGGKGLNQSIAIARAGCPISHAGIVGQGGKLLISELAKSGVDTSLIVESDLATGHAVIQVTDLGENSILIYGGTNRTLTLTYIREVLSGLNAGDTVVLQNEVNLVGEIISIASELGLRIAFNAAPMTPRVLDYPLEKLEWLMVNEIEGEAITGVRDPLAIVKALRSSYPDTIPVLTIGKHGALTSDHENIYRTAAYRVEAVDSTAAGDTFNGYFLSAVLKGFSLLNALTLGSAAAAICVTSPGAAVSIPVLETVEEFLSLYPATELKQEVIPL